MKKRISGVVKWSLRKSRPSEFNKEKAIATHSSTLAWKIPWTEEPGRLQSMGSQRSDTTERLNWTEWRVILDIFSWTYWLFANLWRNFYSGYVVLLLLGSKSSFCILDVRPLSGNMICKNILTFFGLLFHFLDNVLWSATVLNFY